MFGDDFYDLHDREQIPKNPFKENKLLQASMLLATNGYIVIGPGDALYQKAMKLVYDSVVKEHNDEIIEKAMNEVYEE